MFLHIGNSKVVALQELVGIFNVKLQNSAENKHFFERFSENPFSNREKETTNSLVITADSLYESPISPVTLHKRIMKRYQK